MGLGEPDFPTPEPIIDSCYSAIKEGYTRYSSSNGLLDLRLKIADRLKYECGIAASENQLIMSFGAKQAMSMVLTASLQPDDEIIIIRPCYGSYSPQIKLAEPRSIIKEVDLRKSDFELDVSLIEKACSEKTKGIIINYPHNPTGAVLNEKNWKSLLLF